MLNTIESLSDQLHYIDARGQRIPAVARGAIMTAVRRGSVVCRKDEEGRWLIDDQCAVVRRWFAKKNRLQKCAQTAITEDRVDDLRERITRLMEVNRELERQRNDLRARIIRAQVCIRQLEHQLRQVGSCEITSEDARDVRPSTVPLFPS